MAENANGATQKGKVGRKCTVCTHPDAVEINKTITEGVSFRNIERQYGMHYSSVARHVEGCLDLDLRSIADAQVAKFKVDVYEEFSDQLAFAKQLKQAARDFLSDTDDPLKLLIVPQAHEIEVVYYDHNDLETIGFGENAVTRPKKKKAQLSVILQSLADEGMEPDKFTIKTVDIRKFALDAIATADMCIDKFARMGGAYQKDKSNEHDVADLIEGLVDRLIAKGWEREAARTFATSKYGAGVPKLLTNGG